MSDTTTPPNLPDETEHVQLLSQPTPSHIQTYREQDTARVMYPSAQEFNVAVPDDAFNGSDASGAQSRTAVLELRRMFADTGMSPQDAATLMRRSGVASTATAQDQKRATRELFTQTFRDDAGAALQDARKLVDRDPRFKKFIDVRGLGNDPKTAVILAHAARSLKMAGKL